MNYTTTTEVRDCRCPHCRATLDAASYFGNARLRPSAGDISICIYCAGFLRFGAGLVLEVLPMSDILALPPAVKREMVVARIAIIGLADAVEPRGVKH